MVADILSHKTVDSQIVGGIFLQMNEFETLLNSVEDVKVRDVVKGEILTIENGQATVAIVGTGVEGVLTLREITNDQMMLISIHS